jgi:8-oxo-dGTP diphosphatase
MDTVYTVAFMDGRFLMVYNPRRGGWEMPGGRIEPGETPEDAAKREFAEESGYDVTILGTKETDDCWVCAGIVGDRVCGGEMVPEFFSELPDRLAFAGDEYAGVIGWAGSVLR